MTFRFFIFGLLLGGSLYAMEETCDQEPEWWGRYHYPKGQAQSVLDLLADQVLLLWEGRPHDAWDQFRCEKIAHPPFNAQPVPEGRQREYYLVRMPISPHESKNYVFWVERDHEGDVRESGWTG